MKRIEKNDVKYPLDTGNSLAYNRPELFIKNVDTHYYKRNNTDKPADIPEIIGTSDDRNGPAREPEIPIHTTD